MTTQSTVSHTPGPWRLFVEDDDGPAKLPGTYTVDDAALEWVAQGITTEANARLIAAAPDLLAALQAVADDYGGYSDQVRAAIAKATGEGGR